MYSLYNHPRYFKFKRKYQQHGLCFQTIFPFKYDQTWWIEIDWGKKHTPYAKEQCSLISDMIHQFPEHHVPFDVFSAVTNLDGLVKLLVDEGKLRAQQNGKEFHTNEKEVQAF